MTERKSFKEWSQQVSQKYGNTVVRTNNRKKTDRRYTPRERFVDFMLRLIAIPITIGMVLAILWLFTDEADLNFIGRLTGFVAIIAASGLVFGIAAIVFSVIGFVFSNKKEDARTDTEDEVIFKKGIDKTAQIAASFTEHSHDNNES